ncbi:MAG: branched-chain amino acid transporter permease [Hyphomicrobiales bacterium]|nr:branched-chain amino acid transporter permease [Hyphomicrobiales bacterium]
MWRAPLQGNSMAGLSLELIGLQLFAGLALGSVYVLLAIGLSLIFGMLTVVNFAHGAFFMLGAYVGLWLLSIGVNFWICLVAVPLIVGGFGLAVERVLIRPLYGRGIDYPLLLTFGLSYIIIELVRIVFGKSGYPVDTPALLQGAVDIGVGYFPLYRLFVMAVTGVILIGLWLFLERTSYGLIIRAGARDPQIVRVLGVNIARVWLMVFGLGCGIAGLGGLLAAPLQGVIPEMGGPILAEAFVVTVVGGMGSLLGAVLAGLLVGVVVSITSLFAPEMAKVAIFALMAVVLLIRPQGFFGRAGLMS